MSYKKKALVIVPHQDDELILVGPFWDKLQDEYEVFVAFTTNGDYDLKQETNGRLLEALSALQELGVQDSHVIFMGYGDKWKGKHIYNASQDEIKVSHCGRHETYALANHQDFHYIKYGEHAAYTRKNFLSDMVSVIESIHPDAILCCDIDEHPDHIATSLLFEEAVGMLMKKDEGYHPLVLKKFNYNGSWFGRSDYWLYKETIMNAARGRFAPWGYELENPAYSMEKALAVYSSRIQYTEDLKKSQLYTASLKYKSQPLYLRLHKVMNSNSLFWERRTDNLAFYADIWATSGNASALNDFKLLDCKDVNSGRAVGFCEYGWIPKPEDARKEIKVRFKNIVSIKKICLYEIITQSSHVEDCVIKIKDKIFHTGPFRRDGICNEIVFDKEICNVESLSVSIEKYVGERPGLAEIEIFDKEETESHLFTEQTECPQYVRKPIKNLLFSVGLEIQYFFRFKAYFGVRKAKNIILHNI